MLKARKRFVLYAMLCVFVLLFVLLGIINLVNFTAAGDDADQVTKVLAEQQGIFGEPVMQVPDLADINLQDMTPPDLNGQPFTPPDINAPDFTPPEIVPQGQQPVGFFPGILGPMGPNSPEMEASLRYFTFSFDPDGSAELVALQISAVTEDEAQEWARSLLGGKETGWSRTYYRYRVYESNGKTCVTVIDQSRELLPSYRILIISGIGLLVGTLVSCLALMFIGRKLFKPLEEADRKQKRFIADAEKELKVPLTIINANTEIMERENGENKQTQSVNRQIKKMLGLVKNLSNVGVFDEKDLAMLQCNVTELAQAAGDVMKSQFEANGRTLAIVADEPVTITGDSEAMNDLITELLNNALRFSVSKAELFVGRKDGHSVIIASNDTTLPEGNVDQVFDRFARLDNAEGIPGAGLGLSHVKEIVQAHNARASAQVVNGEFILRINL